MTPKSEERFIKTNFITIIVTFVVILAGGIVRSTGSGMGCPDWPKCFGQYVPPTAASQLPNDYKEKYVAHRLEKNERFAKTLDRLGKHNLANRIRNDKSIAEPETFNVAKTWTEYINRLAGVLCGFGLVFTAVFSFAYRKVAKRITVLSVINLLVVGYQGWLGSIVVSTNLMQWVVTVHMLLALVILMILIYTYNYAKQLNKQPSVIMYRIVWLKGFLLFTLAVLTFQIVLGTEVREQIDHISKSLSYNGRNTWVTKVGALFSWHRDIAILTVICNIVVYKMVIDRFSGKALPLRMAKFSLAVMALQLLTGVLLSYLGLPPVAQLLHVLLSTILFSALYYLYLLVYRTQTYKPN